MVDGTQFECDFVNGRAEGWVVSTFTRSNGDLDTDTGREDYVVTGPFVARSAAKISEKKIDEEKNIRFSRGKMTGHVWWSVMGGGWIHGPVDTETGEVTGDELMYIYPDMEHVLYGTFRRGAMVSAVPTTVADIGET